VTHNDDTWDRLTREREAALDWIISEIRPLKAKFITTEEYCNRFQGAKRARYVRIYQEAIAHERHWKTRFDFVVKRHEE